MCLDDPVKMRFQSTEKLVKDYEQEQQSQSDPSDKKKEMASRNERKHNCYVLDVAHREMNLHEIKMLGLSIEEAVNEAVNKSKEEGKEFGNGMTTNQQNFKA